MITRHPPSVERGVRGILLPALALGLAALALALAACVDIQGAAAEFNWSIRDFSGAIIDRCERAGIAEVRLEWRSPADPESTGHAAFDCDIRHGVTDFAIRPGAQLLSVAPLCPDGEPPTAGTYSVPPPILREMRDGEVVSLDSLLIVAHDRGADLQGCSAEACTCE